jgi:putative transposase
VKFAAIADWADSGAFPVDFMCRELGVSRSGFYAWRGRAPSERSRTDTGLLAIIKALHERLRGKFGVRRVHAELRVHGHQVSPKRVWRLCRPLACKDAIPRHGSGPPPPGSRRCRRPI